MAEGPTWDRYFGNFICGPPGSERDTKVSEPELSARLEGETESLCTRESGQGADTVSSSLVPGESHMKVFLGHALLFPSSHD